MSAGYRAIDSLRLEKGYRLKAKLREDRPETAGPNEVRAMGCVHDQLALGQKLRILTVVDIHSRYCPAADPRFACRGEDVVQTLERVCGQVGSPRTIRVDNGSEFISRDPDLRAYANNVILVFSRPGKPTDNGFVEAFNSKPKAECLNAHWFMDLADAQEKLEAWRKDYNEVRPQSAIGYNVPMTGIFPVAHPPAPVIRAAKLQHAAIQDRGTQGRRQKGHAYDRHPISGRPPGSDTLARDQRSHQRSDC